MNKFPSILFLLPLLAAALYLIPTATAQDTSMLTDGLSGIWETLSGYGSQVSAYVSEHVPETAAIGTTTGIAGVTAVGWKYAAKAKGKLESAISSLTGEKEGLLTQVNTYKSQAEDLQTQLANIPVPVDPTEAINKIKTDASSQLAEMKNQLIDTQNLLSTAKLQKQEIEEQYKTLQTRYQELRDLHAVP